MNAPAPVFQKQHHRHSHTLLQFNKAVIRNQAWEISLVIGTDITKIKVFQVREMATVKGDQYGNYFAICQRSLSVSDLIIARIQLMFGYFSFKFFAEIVNFNENFDNFIRTRLGYHPAYKSGKELFYLSMLREERTPSFCVDDKLGVWYDWGGANPSGIKGGNVIDLALAYWYPLCFRDVLQRINETCNIEPETAPVTSRENFRPRKATKIPNYKISEVKDLGNKPAITNYLQSRGIWPVAHQHLKEVYYYIEDEKKLRKYFFSAGWKNENGGWEVNNPYFKGCLGPKGLTIIPGDSNRLALFEGMIDYLSWKFEQQDDGETVILLNRVTFIEASNLNVYLDTKYLDIFWFLSLQDVFLSDENSFVVFASQSESCLQLSLRASAQDEGVSNTRNSYSLMDAYQKLKGRPQLTERKRTKKIDVRFTEDEYKIILALEQELGITKTELIRQRLLQNGKSIVINAKELIARLDAIGAELGRSGNNINQLARYATILQKKDSSTRAKPDDISSMPSPNEDEQSAPISPPAFNTDDRAIFEFTKDTVLVLTPAESINTNPAWNILYKDRDGVYHNEDVPEDMLGKIKADTK
eukprot:gene7119-7185_t